SLNTLNTHHPCPYSAQITALQGRCSNHCATRSRRSVLQFTLNKDLACLVRNLCGLGNFYVFTQCDPGPRFLVVHPDWCSRKTGLSSQSRTDSLHDIPRDGANFATMDEDGRAEGIVILCPTHSSPSPSAVQHLKSGVPLHCYPALSLYLKGAAGSVTVLQRRHILVRSGPDLSIIYA
ncbi:hypothetical protein BDW22DRAFT_1364406, partial [Trametopsis cervina]